MCEGETCEHFSCIIEYNGMYPNVVYQQYTEPCSITLIEHALVAILI